MWPSRPEKLLMLGLLIWGLLLFWATHYIGDIAQVRRSATIYQLDEIVSFVSEPCCLIVFLQPWMYPTFYGLYYLFVIFAPAIFAFAFGKGWCPLFLLPAYTMMFIFILVPIMAWTCWGFAWLSAFLAIIEERRARMRTGQLGGGAGGGRPRPS